MLLLLLVYSLYIPYHHYYPTLQHNSTARQIQKKHATNAHFKLRKRLLGALKREAPEYTLPSRKVPPSGIPSGHSSSDAEAFVEEGTREEEDEVKPNTRDNTRRDDKKRHKKRAPPKVDPLRSLAGKVKREKQEKAAEYKVN